MPQASSPFACKVCAKAGRAAVRFFKEMPINAEEISASGLPVGWSVVPSMRYGGYYFTVCSSLCAAAADDSEVSE